MNKVIKIMLSVMIVSLSTLFIFLESWNGDINICSTITQETIVNKINTQSHCELIVEIYVEEIKSDYEVSIEEMNEKIKAISNITDRKKWFQAYKSIIEEYKEIIDLPETIYDYFTAEELDMLFRVVQAEVGEEYSFTQKVNVAAVIFNRLNHERFPDTLLEILTPDQFSPIESGRYEKVEVSEATILACEYAFLLGSDITEECLFFDSNGKLKYEYVDNDGAHNFYKLKEIE